MGRHARTKASTSNHRLCILSLEADIEFQMINITIELLSCIRNLGIGVPLQECTIRYQRNLYVKSQFEK